MQRKMQLYGACASELRLTVTSSTLTFSRSTAAAVAGGRGYHLNDRLPEGLSECVSP